MVPQLNFSFGRARILAMVPKCLPSSELLMTCAKSEEPSWLIKVLKMVPGRAMLDRINRGYTCHESEMLLPKAADAGAGRIVAQTASRMPIRVDVRRMPRLQQVPAPIEAPHGRTVE
jgi:hypothetical protein